MSANTRNALFRAKLSQQLLKQTKGFTLIELLVVIVIVGVLSAIAVPTFLNQVRRSRAAEGESALATTASAVTVYAFDCGNYNPAAYTNLLGTIDCAGGTALEGPWADQDWTVLAPNYDLPTFAGDIDQGTMTTLGSAAAYTGISCLKSVGNAPTGDDGCTIP